MRKVSLIIVSMAAASGVYAQGMESVAAAPYQQAAVGVPQIHVPYCTATQVLGTSGTQLVCRDMPVVVGDETNGCMRMANTQMCYGNYTPRTVITFAQPFLNDDYAIVATVEGTQDRFSTVQAKSAKQVVFWSYAAASGSKNSGAAGTYVAIGRWK